ncbi:MAG: hypothetical protein WAL66_19765 [Nitrososphaeraceae archaeon]
MSISSSFVIPHSFLQQQAIAETTKSSDNANVTPVNKKLVSHNEDFAIYKNSAFGIIMQYPLNWEKMEGDDDQDSSDKQVVKFISPMKDHSDKYPPSLTVSIHSMHHDNIKDFFGLFDKPTSQAISLRGFMLSHLTSLSTKLLDFKIIKPESYETTLAGNNVAQKIVYTFRKGQEDTTAKVMEVMMIKDDRGYIIRYSADSAKYLYYLPTIQKVTDSFELTK